MLLSFLKPFPEYSDTHLKENLNNSNGTSLAKDKKKERKCWTASRWPTSPHWQQNNTDVNGIYTLSSLS